MVKIRDQALEARCERLLSRLGMEELAAALKVEWNPRMRTAAGRAFWLDVRIELNPKLKVFGEEEVQRTLLHELAHVVAHARVGQFCRIKAHGAEWQQACVDLGIPGERATHSLPLERRKMRKKWRYTCPECEAFFDRVRKMKRVAGCYTCCKKHNGGRYHKKFRLMESALV